MDMFQLFNLFAFKSYSFYNKKECLFSLFDDRHFKNLPHTSGEAGKCNLLSVG